MDDLTALADDFYAFTLAASPLDHMWDGKLDHLAEWDDFTPAGTASRVARAQEFAQRAAAFDTAGDPQSTALRDAVEAAASSMARGAQWSTELELLNPKMGAFELVMSFIDNYPLTTAQHGEDYLEKLRGMPAAFQQIAQVATASAEHGVVALASHLTAGADAVATYLSSPEGDEDRLAAQEPPTELGADARAAWAAERSRIIAEVVRPGLAVFEASLRSLAASGMPDDKPGLVHLPGGAQAYQDKIYAHLLLERTGEEIHQIGLDTVASIEDEYRAIAPEVLGTEDIAQIYAALRDDQSMKYTDAQTLITDAERALAKAEAAAPEWFAVIPQSPCRAVATPFGAMAYYSSPDLETGKVGTFYFNTSHPEAWSTYELEAIVFHEGIPGHHLHLALNAENTALHKVQREMHSTAYAEGWGLYTERLADEMGLYSSPLSRLGMLSADSLRACRLVVDTGMHALGWSREQAIQYMLDHTPMDRGHIEQEVHRYIGLPGQALAYMIGRLEILDMRREAQQRPGFDIRDFHDRFLRHGSVPLSTARQQVLAD
ncbi:DUF885 domain-containing protein [Demequina activiva]|uniref:DUF885 domain-containing protein n=1 Tax=Demequina activiva TaxID=1582364 RepID=A0A919UFA4_9MICO|nr:DUF885 domain-containing protein [Demequina activiva]GIG53289.1 hypothetical protein Dac01nite_00410 [Demequina activiva]